MFNEDEIVQAHANATAAVMRRFTALAEDMSQWSRPGYKDQFGYRSYANAIKHTIDEKFSIQKNKVFTNNSNSKEDRSGYTDEYHLYVDGTTIEGGAADALAEQIWNRYIAFGTLLAKMEQTKALAAAVGEEPAALLIEQKPFKVKKSRWF